MGGGLIQLVAYGAQDVYLTGNPQITLFKSLYRRHTNFSMETIENQVTNADFGKRSYVVVSRNGDLITKCYLKVVLPSITDAENTGAAFAWVRKIGTSLIEEYKIEIGGAEIDKQFGDWLNIWQEVASEIGHDRGYAKLIGDVPELTRLEKARDTRTGIIKDAYTLKVPLLFWFCRNYGLALPLIALQYHEVKFTFNFRAFSECCVYTKAATKAEKTFSKDFGLDTAVCIDYIYLDSDERRRFAQVGHEYLIEQVQFTNDVPITSGSISQQLFFNHPVKSLFWILKMGAYQGNSFLAYSDTRDWSTAIEVAAQSIALGRILLSPVNRPIFSDNGTNYFTVDYNYNPPSGTTPGTANLITSSAVSPPSGFNASNVMAVPVSFVFPEVDVGSVVVSGVFGCVNFVMIQKTGNVLVPKTGTTGDLAHKVHVDRYQFIVDEPAPFPSPTSPISLDFGQASLVANNLTVSDLSIPLEKFTDNRNNAVKVTDVLVWQHDNYGLLIDGTINPVVRGNLKLNGHDRFTEQDGTYFNYVQTRQHFLRTPADGVNVYSFAVDPTKHQPSGSCNMSRIDTAQLNLHFDNLANKNSTILNRADFIGGTQGFGSTIANTRLFVFALSYNILRVMSGMAGLAYSS
jgi:hypothetical protein